MHPIIKLLLFCSILIGIELLNHYGLRYFSLSDLHRFYTFSISGMYIYGLTILFNKELPRGIVDVFLYYPLFMTIILVVFETIESIPIGYALSVFVSELYELPIHFNNPSVFNTDLIILIVGKLLFILYPIYVLRRDGKNFKEYTFFMVCISTIFVSLFTNLWRAIWFYDFSLPIIRLLSMLYSLYVLMIYGRHN